MEAADGNYGARLEYIRHMETVVGKIFEMIFEEIDEMNRIAETLDKNTKTGLKMAQRTIPTSKLSGMPTMELGAILQLSS